MDTYGLLAAWVGIVSFLVAIFIAIPAHFFIPQIRHVWAKTSRKRSEKRLQSLLADLEGYDNNPDTRYIADLVRLYGGMILNLVAAIGLVMMSIEILDLGSAILSAMLPFSINSKVLTRITGILTLIISYFFILRLTYLAIKIRLRTFARTPENMETIKRQISQLRARLASTV